MLLPTIGIDATSSIKRSLNRRMLMVLESCVTFDSYLTFHTGIVYHVSHYSDRKPPCITFSPYRSFQLASLF